ncbi:hypothetical protein CAC42_7417 [Sphaceloma murrayae]|uniref:Pre-mRNA-splicing factor 38B n=1 Tax=Sphaceloma murrayae TaxID=2082308 RepID=A0A2K1QXE0_9PEZI|nr:hypothetical protein CAC42_7417 [Sphaceloma murrayae]
MVADTPLTDDYVAELLAKDAKAVSARAAAGLSMAIGKRPSTTAKPNTRFLRNILRDTDAHNAALLAKEAEESRARLKALEPKRKRQEQQMYSVRARREGGDSLKRRRVDGDSRDSRTYNEGSTRTKRTREFMQHDQERKKDRNSTRYNDREERPEGKANKHRSTDSHLERRPRSRSPVDRQRRRRQLESPPSRSRIKADVPEKSSRRRRSRSTSIEGSVIGPRRARETPVVHSRGRGIAGLGEAMDARFEAGYDPASDVRIDSDEDDWDQALEALKDRQKWKEKGAERLKAAGFSDADVKKWSSGKQDADDVRWAKKGEDREWDRGKTVDST